MGTRRLFVSVDLPEALAEAIAAVQGPFADLPGIRPVDPAQTHITMKFLGDVDASHADEIADILESAVSRAEIGPFEARFGGLGVFPDFEYISVIWVGVRRGGSELERLHEAIEADLVSAEFDPESHAFTPHVTIARMDHSGGKAEVQELLRTSDPDVGEMTVSEVCLTESTLTNEGPRYETIAHVPL